MGKTFWRGMGNLRPSVMRGGLVKSAPQSGEEREREHCGKKEEWPGVRNEERTYDYKGLLISLWRGVAWGSGVETGGLGMCLGCSARRTPALAMWERPEGSRCCMMLCTTQVRARLQIWSGRVGLVPVPVPPSCLEARDTRNYIRPDGRFFFLSVSLSLPACIQ